MGKLGEIMIAVLRFYLSMGGETPFPMYVSTVFPNIQSYATKPIHIIYR